MTTPVHVEYRFYFNFGPFKMVAWAQLSCWVLNGEMTAMAVVEHNLPRFMQVEAFLSGTMWDEVEERAIKVMAAKPEEIRNAQ